MKIYNDNESGYGFDWQDIVVLTGCAFALGFVIGMIASSAL